MVPVAPPRSLALVFLKLGLLAFGGPAAHVAWMRREVVERRGWVEEKDFFRMFAACTLIPGPSSTELAIYLGYRLAGWLGLVLAGALFILPATLIMLGLAIGYVHWGSNHLMSSALDGIRPVVIAIIVWAISDLGRRILNAPFLWLIALGALGLSLAALNPVLVLALAGLAGLLAVSSLSTPAQRLLFAPMSIGPVAMISIVWQVDRIPTLFLTFLKLGAVSFGSGYVLFAFLHADFVAGLHWLSDRQLTDAVAIGQATPGPVFTTATFLGYLFAGVPGALLATLAIFLPGFCLVPLLDRIVRLVETHGAVKAFLDGVNVGAIGLIAAVVVQLAHASIHGPLTAALALLALPILFWRPMLAPALIVLGGLIGLLAM